MGFLASLELGLKKAGHCLVVGTAAAKAAEPLLNLIPVYGPVISTAIDVAVSLEAQFPGEGLGSAKATLAVSEITTKHPEVSTASAQAINNAVVGWLNGAESSSPEKGEK